MTIHSLLSPERPREKLLARGAEQLTDIELLAVLIGSGCQGQSALTIARQLISHWQSVNALCQADFKGVNKSHGVSRVFYARLHAGLELANRCAQETMSRSTVLENPQTSRRFLINKLRHLKHEVFAVLFLDNAHRLIQFEVLFHGTINGASVYPRRVLERSMQLNAAAVILAHNHPSGVAEPSQADEQITQTLITTLRLVDIRVLDHLVIAANEAVSFAERGLI